MKKTVTKAVRRMPLLLSLMLLISSLPVFSTAAPVQAAGAELLSNPGFETGDMSGWTVTEAAYGLIKHDSNEAHSGNYFFNYWYDKDYEFKLSQSLTGLENGTYELRAWTSGGGGEARLKLFAQTSGASGTLYSTEMVNTGWGKWQQYTVGDIAVSDGELVIGFDVAAPAETWGYFDDIELIRTDTLAPPVDPDDFIKGADISTLQALEDQGVKFYDEVGQEKDLLLILKEHGVNYIRLRIWNDPVEAGGYNDSAHALALAKRVKAAGLKLLADFHYSDFWADPGKQVKPKAWEGLTYSELKQAVYSYTSEVLNEMKQAGAYPDMVQIGNEINNGMIHPEGSTSQFDQLAELLQQGAQAVRDTQPSGQHTLIMLHLAEGGNNGKFRSFFDQISSRQVDYDIIGLSYYPYWHGTLQDLKNNMNDLVARYGKQVVVAETAYPYTYEDGDDSHGNIAGENETAIAGLPASVANQQLMLEAVFNTVASVQGQQGLGAFYWEPAWLPGVGWKQGEGNAWENQAMFDYSGHALPSLKAFEYRPDRKPPLLPLLVYPSDPMTVAKGTAPVLPAAAKVLYNEGTIHSEPVVWQPVDESLWNRPGKVRVYGTVAGTDKQAQIEVTVTELVNLAANPGFETGDLSDWTLSGQSSAGKVEDNPSNAHTGSHAFNYWLDQDYAFKLEQVQRALPSGIYTLKVWSSGGGGEMKMKLFAESTSSRMEADIVNTGWNQWKSYEIAGIQVRDGLLKLGVEVEAPAEVWGYLDDMELIRTGNLPNQPSDPGTGNSGGSTETGGGTGAAAQPSVPAPGTSGTSAGSETLRLTKSQLEFQNGGAVFTLPDAAHQLLISADTAEILAAGGLELKGKAVRWQLPGSLFKQLRAEQKPDEDLFVRVDRPDDAESAGRLERFAAHDDRDRVQLRGPSFRIAAGLMKGTEVQHELRELESPILTAIRPDEGSSRLTTGLFYWNESGEPVYTRGHWDKDELIVELKQTGTYSVLQVDHHFKDVDEDHPYYEAVAALAARQVVKGTDQARFEPERLISRAEFIVMLARTLQLPSAKTSPFMDVKEGQWYADALAAAYQAGMVQGKGDGSFMPDKAITRKEIQLIMQRALQWQQEQGQAEARPELAEEWTGMAPAAPSTRGEAAQSIVNLLNP